MGFEVLGLEYEAHLEAQREVFVCLPGKEGGITLLPEPSSRHGVFYKKGNVSYFDKNFRFWSPFRRNFGSDVTKPTLDWYRPSQLVRVQTLTEGTEPYNVNRAL